ncbi:MAG: hypothetical protein ACFFA4_05825 [Promethearchaeota archaeon]
MNKNIDLKTIEKNVLKTAHQHGLFDIILGFVVTGMSFGPIFREGLPTPYNYFLWPLIIVSIACVVPIFIIKYVIQPRTGIAKPGTSLKSIGKKLIVVISVQFVIQIIFLSLLVVGNGSGIQVQGIVFILIIGLFIIPICAIIAYLMKFSRLYFIGMLIWLAVLINDLLHAFMDYRIRWLLSYGIIGCIILIIGLVIFIRFLKKYPLPKEEIS